MKSLAWPAALLLLLGGSVATDDGAKAVSSLACNTGLQAPVWIAGGETQIGDDAGYTDERPSYRTHVDGFWIDRFEVTNAQFADFVKATGYVTSAERRGDSMVFIPPTQGQIPTAPDQWWKVVEGADWQHPEGPDRSIEGRAHLPVVHVSHRDALAYAAWVGRRLPSEEEFERAARVGLVSLNEQPEPDSANTWQGSFPIANLKYDGYAGLAPVGCYKANAPGAHDLIGNAWEWTSSWYLPGHGPAATKLGNPGKLSFDPNQPGIDVRVIKGGSFLCAPNYCARYRPSARHAQAEYESASHIGFRTVTNRKSDQ